MLQMLNPFALFAVLSGSQQPACVMRAVFISRANRLVTESVPCGAYVILCVRRSACKAIHTNMSHNVIHIKYIKIMLSSLKWHKVRLLIGWSAVASALGVQVPFAAERFMVNPAPVMQCMRQFFSCKRPDSCCAGLASLYPILIRFPSIFAVIGRSWPRVHK